MTNEQQNYRRIAMAEAVAGGQSVEQVANIYNMSLESVRNACRRANVIVVGVPRGRPMEQKAFRALKMLLDGSTLDDVAKLFGCSKQYVYQIRDRAIEAGFAFPAK